MRDTGDMMEDTFSEDTMMECSGDDAGLDDLVDLTDDVSHSAPTIRDAAARLLTLLGVEDDEDDDDDASSLSSSEDEGVELDEDSDDNNENDDNDNVPQNTRLLHQLATSLAQELKYSQKQSSKSNTRLSTIQRFAKTTHENNRVHVNEQHQCMEVGHDICYQDNDKNTKYLHQAEQTVTHKTTENRGFFDTTSLESIDETMMTSGKYRTEPRSRMSSVNGNVDGKTAFSVNTGVKESWTIGWDVCAAEAIRYLVEDEGLSPHHPTVLAMKSHLEIQRERALAQYAV